MSLSDGRGVATADTPPVNHGRVSCPRVAMAAAIVAKTTGGGGGGEKGCGI